MRFGMNIAGTEYTLQDRAFDIFVSGCSRECPGCFNPEAQDFDFGEELFTRHYTSTTEYTTVYNEIFNKITDFSEIIDKIRVMGGDLLEQKTFPALFLTYHLKESFPDKELVLFTGADEEEIPDWCFELFDTIKCGRFIQELKQDGFPASSNQKILKRGVDY